MTAAIVVWIWSQNSLHSWFVCVGACVCFSNYSIGCSLWAIRFEQHSKMNKINKTRKRYETQYATPKTYCNRVHVYVRLARALFYPYRSCKTESKIWDYCFNITTMQLSFNAVRELLLLLLSQFSFMFTLLQPLAFHCAFASSVRMIIFSNLNKARRNK